MCRLPPLCLSASVLDDEDREGRRRRRKGWVEAGQGWGGGGSHWHSSTSLVLTCVQRAICRSGSEKKTLLSFSVTQQVSAASFLSRKLTHQSKDPVLCFLSTLCLSVCFLSLSTPGRQMRLSWRRLKEGSAFQSELFPEESRYVRASGEVRVIWKLKRGRCQTSLILRPGPLFKLQTLVASQSVCPRCLASFSLIGASQSGLNQKVLIRLCTISDWIFSCQTSCAYFLTSSSAVRQRC